MGIKLNIFTSQFDVAGGGGGGGGAITWKATVVNEAALPLVGNTAGDARITLDSSNIWVWDGAAWVDQSSELAIGSTVNSGTPEQVLYVDASGNLAQEARLDLSRTAAGTADLPLIGQGAGIDPAYQALDLTSSGVSGQLPTDKGGTGQDFSADTGVIKVSAGVMSASSIVNADVDNAAAIDATKIADGSVDNTEFQYLNGLTANIQDQLNDKVDLVSSTDNAVTRFDGTGGAVQDSLVTIDDLGAIDGVTALDMDGDIVMNGNTVTGLAAPSASTDAATKEYVDAVAEGLKPKQAVRAATTVAGTLTTDFENGDSIDGVTLATNDRILIKDQAAPAENGIYIVQATGAPTRASDFDSLTPIDEVNGAIVGVQEGTANQGKIFVQSGVVGTIGTDPITFVFFNSVDTLVGGDGITVSGSNLSVDHDGEGLTFVAAQLALELDGGTLTKAAAGLKVTDLGIDTAQLADESVSTNKLQDSSVTSLKLDTGVAGDGIAGGAGTALSVDHDGEGLTFVTNQLALELDGATLSKSATGLKVADGGIADAQIAAAAGIDATKIGLGNVDNTEFDYLDGVTSSIQSQLNDKVEKAASSTDNAIARFDGTGGDVLQDSAVIISDLGAVTGATALTVDNITLDGSSITNASGNLSIASTAGNVVVEGITFNNVTISTSGNPLLVNSNNNNTSITAGTADVIIASDTVQRSKDGTNFVIQEYVDAITLNANVATPTTIAALTTQHASTEAVIIEYKIKEATSNKVRVGRFMVATNGTDVTHSDTFSETDALGSALGLELTAVISGADLLIQYNNTNATNACTMRADVKLIRT